MKAVFDVGPGWRDSPDYAVSYAYPSRSDYVVTALAALGDWIVFRERGRSVASQGYFAVAQLIGFDRHDALAGQHVARFTDFLAFPSPPGIRLQGIYAESRLRVPGTARHVGHALQGKHIRTLEENDFTLIVHAGFAKAFGLEDLYPSARQTANDRGFDEAFAPFSFEPASLRETLQTRSFRDANFRLLGGRAYSWTCALTGIPIRDKHGHAEVEIAHIWPFEQFGPDIVQNGIALSRTPHWMFDHLLFTIDTDYRLITAPIIPDRYRSIIPLDGHLRWPTLTRDWPAQKFLEHHRARFRDQWRG